MDLTQQPPRRPSNPGMAGIVGLARMTDKARAHDEELLGEYVYGEKSGLDREVLELIGMSAAEFAAAASELDDGALSELVLGKVKGRQGAVEAFNREHLEREPQDERHRQMLAERVARYAPGSREIRTGFQSMELDDWGAFRDADLTVRPPRTPYLRSVVGMFAAARMADKARASRCGRLGEYRYGPDSGFDRAVLTELQLEAEAFAEAAYCNPNDIELSEWVREHGRVDPGRVCTFNAGIAAYGVSTPGVAERFLQRRNELCPERPDIATYFDLVDLDDQVSFGLVDLNRRPPRSPYDTSVGGIVALGRMIDKGRAHLKGSLGTYWFGADSGIDRRLLEYLGLSQAELEEGLRQGRNDAEVVAWLGPRLQRPAGELETFNDGLRNLGPSTDGQRDYLRRTVARYDRRRPEVTTYFAMMVLEDEVHFARQRARV
ncbi:MAG: DUF5069 domain-containing protein [Gemmatimonadota bacterium]